MKIFYLTKTLFSFVRIGQTFFCKTIIESITVTTYFETHKKGSTFNVCDWSLLWRLLQKRSFISRRTYISCIVILAENLYFGIQQYFYAYSICMYRYIYVLIQYNTIELSYEKSYSCPYNQFYWVICLHKQHIRQIVSFEPRDRKKPFRIIISTN